MLKQLHESLLTDELYKWVCTLAVAADIKCFLVNFCSIATGLDWQTLNAVKSYKQGIAKLMSDLERDIVFDFVNVTVEPVELAIENILIAHNTLLGSPSRHFAAPVFASTQP